MLSMDFELEEFEKKSSSGRLSANSAAFFQKVGWSGARGHFGYGGSC